MEDGELQDDVSGGLYHPSLEFPSDDSWLPEACPDNTHSFPYTNDDMSPYTQAEATASSSYSSHTISNSMPVIRLVVVSSDILPQAHKLAVLDGYTQIEIGRDAPQPGTTTPRIRLKEMEVSKVHATLFWDGARRELGAVDMGSKHGTFVRPCNEGSSTNPGTAEGPVASADVGEVDPRGYRLSPPRVSSIPRRLHNLDELSVGSTTFTVHIHEDKLPCAACSPKGGDEIPLFHDKKSKMDEARKRKREIDGAGPISLGQEERNPRKALTMLKRSLLSRHTSPTESTGGKAAYIDRSAKRRALYTSASDAPGIEPRSLVSSPSTSTAASSRPVTPSPPVSAPPTPLPSSNIGHKLLMKQGWQPGTTLGVSEEESVEGSVALVEPLEVMPRSSRTGLGAHSQPASPAPAASTLSWKDEAKFRRWSNLRSEDGSG
ncbi:hypothetical protein NM688_g2434 [Phlebia brevispora]|uniref:Uncharacterized protein n=1 Tax=Phlebia brevispora TaxID=194682 RepID=A0ACC1T8N4_9APHY|nr:hypothetical protein NM688_g2434 [Phlebia brevispora]